MNEYDLLDEPTSEIDQYPGPNPFPPFWRPSSGLYQAWTLIYPFSPGASGLEPEPLPVPGPVPGPLPNPIPPSNPLPLPIPPPWRPLFRREELRLDVDGLYPQMVASGTLNRFFSSSTHWIAYLQGRGRNVWAGTIWYKDGNLASFPYTDVKIEVIRTWLSPSKARVTFSGGGSTRVVTYNFTSPYFHPVDFEFDFEGTLTVTDSIKTWDHPNRPATLPNETLSINTVFRRAGFKVTQSPGGSVPVFDSGPGGQWSDTEMHDAMQTYWSRFNSAAQWAMWVFTAGQHEMGSSLGGIMFDDIGPNHRQGTALFMNSFISNAPAGDPNPAAWVQRMLFWTVCHEMGHAFNLAHSWQKALGVPWIPLVNEPEARSFMNYPYRVAGGESSFFSDFDFRFGGLDQTPQSYELLFLRHAPARFVQMGNADWFDDHGFQEAMVSPEVKFNLQLRVNRESPTYEFMEPVTLELKLTNISAQPQVVEEDLLSESDTMTVILKKEGKPARQFIPYAHYCSLSEKNVLMPGDSAYNSLYVSSGRNGWDLAEPGYYTIQVAIHTGEEDIVSNPLRLRILPPRRYEEDVLAQDFFSDDVGRILYFDGSQFFSSGNNVLREIVEKLGDRRVAIHASLALGKPLTLHYKELVIQDGRLEIRGCEPETEQAQQLLSEALLTKPATAVESLGHIDYKYYTDYYTDWLAKEGQMEEAAQGQDILYDTLATREVRGRKVLDEVLQDVQVRRNSYIKKRKK